VVDTQAHEDEAREHGERDHDIAARVRRIGQEEVAAQLLAAPGLVDAHADVDQGRADDDGEGHRRRRRRRRVGAGEALHAFDGEVEARDEQEPGENEGGERFDLGMTIGVTLVGLLGRHAHGDEADDVVGGIDGRVRGVPEEGETVGQHPGDQLRRRHRHVEQQRHPQHPLDAAAIGASACRHRGRRHAQASAAPHAGGSSAAAADRSILSTGATGYNAVGRFRCRPCSARAVAS
jgi:hypothetical protein